jgi:hypothetical protein
MELTRSQAALATTSSMATEATITCSGAKVTMNWWVREGQTQSSAALVTTFLTAVPRRSKETGKVCSAGVPAMTRYQGEKIQRSTAVMALTPFVMVRSEYVLTPPPVVRAM